MRADPDCNQVSADQRVATLPSFRLDRSEVTVGRFRQFYPVEYQQRVEQGPVEGWGAHAGLADSGWRSDWVPIGLAAVDDDLTQCRDGEGVPQPGTTWTSAPDTNETLPINCVPWIVAFMFCAWDGGYLPTDAEWNYAAAGGSYQYTFPWGDSPAPDESLLVWDAAGPATVGSKLPGRARWGQYDLAGNVAEWCLDDFVAGDPEAIYYCALPFPCTANCVQLPSPAEYNTQMVRGGSWGTDQPFALYRRDEARCTTPSPERGFRCARAAQ